MLLFNIIEVTDLTKNYKICKKLISFVGLSQGLPLQAQFSLLAHSCDSSILP